MQPFYTLQRTQSDVGEGSPHPRDSIAHYAFCLATLSVQEKNLEAAVQKEKAALNQQLKTFSEMYSMALNGVDTGRAQRALEVMYINGKVGTAKDYQGKILRIGVNEEMGAVRDAIRWFACAAMDSRYDDLNVQYFGAKHYDRWSYQRSDHPYGYGPRHGSVVFQIGLRAEYRNKGLTAEQRSDCIYYLEQLKAGKLTQHLDVA